MTGERHDPGGEVGRLGDREPLVDRRQVLGSLGAGDAEIEELLVYGEAGRRDPPPAPAQLPLTDEPHLVAWREYAELAGEQGVVSVLAGRLPQLRFPVQAGISQTEAYRAATRRGVSPGPQAATVSFRRPEALRLVVTETIAGGLPALITGDRGDFETLVRILSARSEPIEVPASMGACLVKGFVNWDRVRRYRQAWEARHPEASAAAWSAEFRRLAGQKAQYQDTFLLLSEGPYSGIEGVEPGGAEAWAELSLPLRLAHEATHYVMLRLLGGTWNHAWDEVLADFVGLVEASGSYREGWALRCLGLEAHPQFRPGGRLANYRGRPLLSDGAFGVLASLVVRIVARLGDLDRAGLAPRLDSPELGSLLRALAPLSLEEMSAIDLVAYLRAGPGSFG